MEATVTEQETLNIDMDQTTEVAPEEPPKRTRAKKEAKQEDVIDILVPKATPKTWKIGPEEYAREYVQKPLSFIAKMQWFSLVGDVLDKALSGPDGITLNNLFSAPGRSGQMSMDDFRDADTFIQAIGKLLAVAPDFLVKSYCIWLNVPDYERDLAAEMMKLPPDEGGLSDEQGIEIIEIFIDQNYEALDIFFRERLGNLQKRIQARVEEANASRRK